MAITFIDFEMTSDRTLAVASSTQDENNLNSLVGMFGYVFIEVNLKHKFYERNK